MDTKNKCGGPKPSAADQILNRIKESHQRAKYVLETSKKALGKPANCGSSRSNAPINISDLVSEKTVVLDNASPPRRTFDPREVTHSTMDPSQIKESMSNCTKPTAKNLSVDDILASSRSEKVRRMSNMKATNESFHRGEDVLKRLEHDEKNFIAEIPMNHRPSIVPAKIHDRMTMSQGGQRIPIELEDFKGPGYIMKANGNNDFSFDTFCNKKSNRVDSMIVNKSPIVCSQTDGIEKTPCIDLDDFSSCGETASPKNRTMGNCTKIKETLKNAKECDTTNYLIDKLIQPTKQKNLAKPCCKPKDRNQNIACQPQSDNRKSDADKNSLDNMMQSMNMKQDRDPMVALNAKRARPSNNNNNCGGKTLIEQFCEEKLKDRCNTSNEDQNDCNDQQAVSIFSQLRSPRDECASGPDNCDYDLKRASSQLSSTSEFNYLSGYLPLKSTHNEISWPSVKLRMASVKTFQIKNTSGKRLIIRAIIDGPGFNFENVDAHAKGTITLQPAEVRTMVLQFNPTVLGPAIGNLIFQPPIDFGCGQCATMSNINSKVTKRVIRLYGYGGHVSCSFERLQQGPVGSKFLPLGNLCNLAKVFEETFIIRNKGNLTAFAVIMLENRTVGKSSFDKAISICPEKVLIPPNCIARVKISFTPTGLDMKEMMKIHRDQEVITVGNILVITGDEPTRCRIKKLITSSEDLSEKYASPQLKNVWSSFGKNDCDYDLCDLRETGLAVADLLGSFTSKEVALTINNSTSDMSLIDASGWISDYDDSAMFHTICQPNENSPCCVSPPGGDKFETEPLPEAQFEFDPVDVSQKEEWKVEPATLEFEPGSVLPQVLTIHSNVFKDKMFEVDSNVANYFSVSPQEGVLRPTCCKTRISVRMLNYNVPPCPLYIFIFIENDRICIPVVVEKPPCEAKADCARLSATTSSVTEDKDCKFKD